MKFIKSAPESATPLDPNEIEGLIPSDIATRDQLNEAEQANYTEACLWAYGGKKKDILLENMIREVHRRMFCRVWRWAGRYRKTDKNLGVPWPTIPEEVGKLISDVQYWIDRQIYSWDELGARFHHRLVSIHPFPNGNGRHGRLITHLLLRQFGQREFSWGQKGRDENFISSNEIRKQYIDSLKKADQHSYEVLIRFVRS